MENKEIEIETNIEKFLLDIAIDFQNELLLQLKKTNCDDQEIDLVNENTIQIFNDNKNKYIKQLSGVLKNGK